MSDNQEGSGDRTSAPVSRRDFLKLAGVAGATIGLGAGLGGLVAACGGTEEATTTTTAAATSTTAGGTVTTAAAAGSTTTVAASAEEGRVVKMGVVSPLTGSLASFAKPDEWIVNTVAATVKDGVVCGDGKLHKFEFKIVDSQSRADRAAQVAGDLILNDKVDMVLASSNPDTVNPVADQCEVNGVPFLANFVPFEAFFFGRGGTPAKPFKWTYMSHYGYAASSKLRVITWDQIPTNKQVGVILPNDTSGQRLRQREDRGALPHEGLRLHARHSRLPRDQRRGLHPADIRVQEGRLRDPHRRPAAPHVHQLLEAVPPAGIPAQDRHHGLALLFHETADALGDIVQGLSAEVVWHPTFPYKSSLTGQTCQELADQYSADTGKGWTEPIGQYGKFEWAIDVCQRTKDLDNKEEYVAAIQSTKLDTINGLIDFTAPVKMGTNHPVLNVNLVNIASGQWVKTAGGAWPYDVELVAATDPNIPIARPIEPIVYA